MGAAQWGLLKCLLGGPGSTQRWECSVMFGGSGESGPGSAKFERRSAQSGPVLPASHLGVRSVEADVRRAVRSAA